ncbi:hypothetical protein VaNZ11_008793 [Volvox africanus]|uniref:SGNH hydrolase-type esterase domain-containing protein n=1 Tax=Volvox africanus TaxID=51714 RepID=A0ABQ5S6W3_9CHLO|nr:hypothetical protein VaNZ11_008793 [Volvox africanus]
MVIFHKATTGVQNGFASSAQVRACFCIAFVVFASMLEETASNLLIENPQLSGTGASLQRSTSELDDDHGDAAATVSAMSAMHLRTESIATTGVMRLLQAAKQYRARSGGQQMLRHRDINRALYMGDPERLRSFVRRMAEGQKLTIALLGGSVSKGMGAVSTEPSFEGWLNAWLAAVSPADADSQSSTAYGTSATAAAAATATATSRGLQSELGNIAGAGVGVGGGQPGGIAGAGGGAPISTVKVINAACPATSSAYMNLCLREYLRDTDVDLVLLEYAINDPPFLEPQMINEPRKSFEQLVRKLLRLPRRPAVVLLNLFRWFSESRVGADQRPSDTYYFTNAEAQFFEFATYYGLPLLSLKAAVYHHMVAGTRGFQVDTLRHLTRRNESADKEALFYEDPMHPSGLTGHRVISELIAGLLLSVARGLVMRPWRPSEEEQIAAALPAHMIPDNYDTDLDLCLMGENFRASAMDIQGFEWLNEGRSALAPKWGYIATVPNASIVFTISHTAITNETAGHVRASVLVILAYLRSYENMGVAAVSCSDGCVCGEAASRVPADGKGVDFGNADTVIARLDGLSHEHNSQLQLGCFPATMLASECRVRVWVENVHREGINKVKLGGLIVSHTAPAAAQGMCQENLEAAERAAGFVE